MNDMGAPFPGMALVKLFVDQWGATVEEYDVDEASGAVSVGMTVNRDAVRQMRVDRNEIIVRRNRLLSVEAGAHVDLVRGFINEFRASHAA